MNRISLMVRAVVRGLLIGALVFLAACSSDVVVQDQSQRDATEIVALLHQHGIASVAVKETGGKSRFTVQVKRGFYAQSVALLSAKGYPRDTEARFSDLVAERGILPSSREIEALRIDHALGLELEELLKSHPAISTAKVLVRLNFNKEGSVPSVSVMVQLARQIPTITGDIKNLIAPLIPGVNADNIQIVVEQSNAETAISTQDGIISEGGNIIAVPLTEFLFGWKIAASDVNSLSIAILLCVVFVLLAGATLGYCYGYYQQTRSVLDRDEQQLTAKSIRIERPRKD